MSGKAQMCPKCGNLVGAEDDQCYTCGLQMGTAGHGVVAARRLATRYGSTTSVLVGMFAVCLLGMYVVQGGPFPENAREVGLLRSLLLGFDDVVYVRCGIVHPGLIREYGEIWRLVTAMFIHGGIVHFGFNTYVMLQLGRLSEVYFDPRRAFTIFFLSGLLASFGSFVAGKYSLGASGAILGLAGAVLVKARVSGGGVDRMIFAQLFRWILLIMLFSVAASAIVDWVAHLVGVVAGGAIGYLLISEGGVRAHVHRVLFWSCIVLCAVGLTAGLAYCLSWPPGYPV